MPTITGIPTYSSAPINSNTVTPSKARSPTASGLGSSKDARYSSPTTPAINTASATSSSSSPSATGQTPRPGAAAIDLLPAPTITSSHHNELPPPTRTTILRPEDQRGSAIENPKHTSISSKTTGDFVPPPPQPGARPQPVVASSRGSPRCPVPDSAPFLATTGGSGSSAPSGPAATTVIPLPANGQAGRSAHGNNHNVSI